MREAKFGDTVIHKATGDIGKVTGFDDQGRTHFVTFRNGSKQWFYWMELEVVE